MTSNPSRNEFKESKRTLHNITMDTDIYDSLHFEDSVDQTFSKMNEDNVVQDLTQATQSNFVCDAYEHAKTIMHPQNTCTKNKKRMLIVTFLVLFVLDGLQIAFIFFSRASHKRHAGEVRIEMEKQLSTLNSTLTDHLLKTTKLVEDLQNWKNATQHELETLHSHSHARDCLEVLKIRSNKSGVYTVHPWDNHPHEVYCDMETDGGGWTVFQNRFDGSVDFYRNFTQYETGFGLLTGEFWLGLQKVYAMTNGNANILRIDLMDANGITAYESFQNFSLSPSPGYNLHIGAIAQKTTTTSVDQLYYHNGIPFKTLGSFHGPWWCHGSHTVNLNGQYMRPGITSNSGIIYNTFRGQQTLKRSKMMYRRY